MKVFFVYWTDNYSDWTHYGIFSTRGKAQDFIDNHQLVDIETKKSQFRISEFELDVPGVQEEN